MKKSQRKNLEESVYWSKQMKKLCNSNRLVKKKQIMHIASKVPWSNQLPNLTVKDNCLSSCWVTCSKMCGCRTSSWTLSNSCSCQLKKADWQKSSNSDSSKYSLTAPSWTAGSSGWLTQLKWSCLRDFKGLQGKTTRMRILPRPLPTRKRL